MDPNPSKKRPRIRRTAYLYLCTAKSNIVQYPDILESCQGFPRIVLPDMISGNRTIRFRSQNCFTGNPVNGISGSVQRLVLPDPVNGIFGFVPRIVLPGYPVNGLYGFVPRIVLPDMISSNRTIRFRSKDCFTGSGKWTIRFRSHY